LFKFGNRKLIIFDDSLPIKTQIAIVLHELAHAVLNHTMHTPDIEQKANIFAQIVFQLLFKAEKEFVFN
jgi:Zn-dependent peptidase ImmA (M78 family)